MKTYQKPDVLFVEANPILSKMQGTGEPQPLPQDPLDCEGSICDDDEAPGYYTAICTANDQIIFGLFLIPGEDCVLDSGEQCDATIDGQPASEVCTGTAGEYSNYGFRPSESCEDGVGCVVMFYCVFEDNNMCDPGITVEYSCPGFEDCDMDTEAS